MHGDAQPLRMQVDLDAIRLADRVVDGGVGHECHRSTMERRWRLRST